MYSIEQQTEYILDSACYDAGQSRKRDGSFAPFGITIDDDGKIETLSLPAGVSAASVFQAERTKITTAVAIVSADASDVLRVHIDFRDGEPICVRAPFRIRTRFLRKPEIDLAAKTEIETTPAERIVFGAASETRT